jgi:aminopeptidase N
LSTRHTGNDPTVSRRSALTALLVAISLTAGCNNDDTEITPASSASTSSAPTTSTVDTISSLQARADGIGDPYYPELGNTGYDVDHYRIDLTFEPPSTLTATVSIDAVATDNLSMFNLDFAGYDITDLTVDDQQAAFARSKDELTIQPTQPITTGDTFTTEIAYTGTPIAGYSDAVLGRVGWLTDGDNQWVASQPDGAHTWYPVNDHPSDKATYTYRITVPTPLVAAANGVLTNTTISDGLSIWEWEMTDPMASHLATVVIGDYQIITDQTSSELAGVEIRNVLPDDLADNPPPDLARLGEMITVLEQHFGPYPFDTYGVAVIDPLFFVALETQTLSLFSRDLLHERVILHELAHQWFGNNVSVDRWQDVWISEGFATYAEWLWIETTQGTDAMNDAIKADQINLDYLDPPPAAHPPPGDLFNLAVYQVGARALHATRLEVGDDTFFEILQIFSQEYGGASATAQDFINLTNELAGRDLTPIFDDWLNDTDLPTLDLG